MWLFLIRYLLVLNKNGTVNIKRIVNGEYEKVKEGNYSLALIDLLERMMDVV
jgi:hypothetical protein